MFRCFRTRTTCMTLTKGRKMLRWKRKRKE